MKIKNSKKENLIVMVRKASNEECSLIMSTSFTWIQDYTLQILFYQF